VTTPAPSSDDPTGWPAHVLSRAVSRGTLRVLDVAAAFLDRADRLEPVHHALVTRRSRDDVLAEAAVLDRELEHGPPRGWLHGLPLAIKDLTDVQGLPTTLGLLPPDAAPVAEADADFVPRLRAAGALFVGKTNTPELGLGSHTYSAVAPTTRNAFDPSLSAGGSSGGAAVAVATGMVPVADGSDFMGSLRNPPGWNGVFGLRPTAPRQPALASLDVRGVGGLDGPVARDATDLALMLATMTGTRPHRPDGRTALRRVAWLGDLAGYLPTEDGLLDACRSALELFGRLGAEVVDASLPAVPDFEHVDLLWPTWLTFRHASVGADLAELAEDLCALDRMKPEAQWEVAGYRTLTTDRLDDTARRRRGLGESFRRLFETFDVVVLPTAQVFPFPVELRWPREIAGRSMDTYHRWMEVTAPATLVGLPVLAVPVPTRGLPIGLQVMGPPGSEPLLLDVAAGWQQEAAGGPGVMLCRPAAA
jgi:amidase